ncbi:serine/threonine protein kinase [Plectonema cf. radiosum LEGE 06105]|uniref:non-specific serine/threonine protein kinase n=1 Tax=Plectonema cf. radiosum LEGE 06105 TaxID=945769 RepID=A0A8J7F3W8_9CYAN|nr:serine/threonine-protein kinase [Plectonema radiosum]MBE9215856.1 serine/threonine protein kinase [Plectonema cf. radiosum LEGE 06105]
MTNYMIGKVLQERYQIVQSLGAGVFGQTYISVDIEHPHNPKRVVKQLKVTSSQPSYLQDLRLRFLTETRTLKHLGNHKQIPQLISCFEENERFYLVQEFIEGHSLSAELPLNQNPEFFWGENAVVGFLKDVLNILEYVHSQGVIHCDVKPENLIRRAKDGKLVLIDFGSIQPVDFGGDEVLPIYTIPVTSLGYIPPEQFIGKTQPNSDIYALGMIAIQALTGLTPLQLKKHPSNNETLWRSRDTAVSDYLAAVISKMIRYDSQQRFQTAKDVLQVLKQIPSGAGSQIIDVEYSVFSDYPQNDGYKINTKLSENKGSSPLLTGMKVGLAANSMIIGFGAYSIVNHTPASQGNEALSQAKKEYESGDLQSAIALAKSIPSDSNVYPEAQATIGEWQQQWQVAAQKYEAAKIAFKESRWTDVILSAANIPNIEYWQTKTDRLVKQAQISIEAQKEEYLAKAYEKAAEKDFNSALHFLRQIPRESNDANLVQQKFAEYEQKQLVRATFLLQQAYNQAELGKFDDAIDFVQKIPKDTPTYAKAQVKLAEYNSKKRLVAQLDKAADSELNSAIGNTDSFINSTTTTKIKDLQIQTDLQEINIQ